MPPVVRIAIFNSSVPCFQTCHANCLTDANNNRVCNIWDGACSYGCKDSFYRQNCSQVCSLRLVLSSPSSSLSSSLPIALFSSHSSYYPPPYTPCLPSRLSTPFHNHAPISTLFSFPLFTLHPRTHLFSSTTYSPPPFLHSSYPLNSSFRPTPHTLTSPNDGYHSVNLSKTKFIP